MKNVTFGYLLIKSFEVKFIKPFYDEITILSRYESKIIDLYVNAIYNIYKKEVLKIMKRNFGKCIVKEY